MARAASPSITRHARAISLLAPPQVDTCISRLATGTMPAALTQARTGALIATAPQGDAAALPLPVVSITYRSIRDRRGRPYYRTGTFGTYRTAFSTSQNWGATVASLGMNERLRVAMTAKSMEIEPLARMVGVDPKTVQRWLAGRIPHPRHRWKLCDILGQSEQDLWPDVSLGASGSQHTSEIVAAYAHRADAPSQLWSAMLDRVRTNLDLLGYSMLFMPEQHPRLSTILEKKCASGLRVRIALADPDGAEVMARDALEELSGTLPGRIRSTMGHLEPLLTNSGLDIRHHRVPLYNAVYRFDDQMLVTPYLHKLHGYQHPLLHLKRLGPSGIFECYAWQFEAIWVESRPAFEGLASEGGSSSHGTR
jgi:transcriptional regulator with XRE-family HTH domain